MELLMLSLFWVGKCSHIVCTVIWNRQSREANVEFFLHALLKYIKLKSFCYEKINITFTTTTTPPRTGSHLKKKILNITFTTTTTPPRTGSHLKKQILPQHYTSTLPSQQQLHRLEQDLI